jgi:tetratricopeptide (TPR) repeat protein
VAHTALGYTRGHLGELQAALDHLERSAAFGHPSHHRFYESINALNPTIAGLCQQGRLLCLLGHPERAVQRAEEALALARSLGVPNAIGFSLVWSAYVHQLRGEPEMVRARTEEALSLSVEHGLADVGSWAAVWHAWSGGDVPAGLATVRESLAAQRSFGSEIARPHQLALYAELLARIGEHAEAERVLDEGLAQAMRTGDRYYEPELHRLKGDVRLALQRGAADAAGHYRQAVEVARRHGSRLLENKAAASLTYLS